MRTPQTGITQRLIPNDTINNREIHTHRSSLAIGVLLGAMLGIATIGATIGLNIAVGFCVLLCVILVAMHLGGTNE